MKPMKFYNIEFGKIVCFDQTFFDDYEQGGWNESRILSDGWYLQHGFFFNRERSLDCWHFGWIEERGRVLYHVFLVCNSGTAWTPSDWSFNRWIRTREATTKIQMRIWNVLYAGTTILKSSSTSGGRVGKLSLGPAKPTSDLGQGVTPWQNGRVSARVSNLRKANGYTRNWCNWSKTSGKG